MASDSSTNIVALAKLDVTPDQVIESERTRLTERIAHLEKSLTPGRFLRFAEWRRGSVVWAYDHTRIEAAQTSCMSSWILSALQTCVVWATFWRWVYGAHVGTGYVTAYIALAAVSFMGNMLVLNGLRLFLKDGRYIFFLLRQIFAPMMAIIRFIDFISLCLPARWFFDQWSTSRELREAQKELEELNDRAPLVVSQYYGAGIDAARKELLGPGAVLPRANVELNAAFGTLLKHDERVAARLNQAAGDADREPALRAAAERIARRKTRLRDAMDSVATTIAKTEAILEECAVLARKIEAPLADRELIREIECAEETEESAILTANLGIEAHLERVRQRVVELTSAIYSTPLALPAASSEERLESYFINVDAVAAKVNALG